MKISVVVPAFNEEKLLPAALHSINLARDSFTGLGWESELVVCDNNSTDQTAKLACAAGARVALEPINQISRARNTGAAAATGDWLLFVDADSRPTVELFADVANAIQSGNCLAGGSTVKLDGFYPVAALLTSGWNILSRVLKWAPGSFIFCETAAFRQVGGFSQELFASEEIKLFQRLKRLARESHRRIVILHRHPLVTSARKIHLYTPREHMLFLSRTLLGGGRTFRDRSACHTWYDGRR